MIIISLYSRSVLLKVVVRGPVPVREPVRAGPRRESRIVTKKLHVLRLADQKISMSVKFTSPTKRYVKYDKLVVNRGPTVILLIHVSIDSLYNM